MARTEGNVATIVDKPGHIARDSKDKYPSEGHCSAWMVVSHIDALHWEMQMALVHSLRSLFFMLSTHETRDIFYFVFFFQWTVVLADFLSVVCCFPECHRRAPVHLHCTSLDLLRCREWCAIHFVARWKPRFSLSAGCSCCNIDSKLVMCLSCFFEEEHACQAQTC